MAQRRRKRGRHGARPTVSRGATGPRPPRPAQSGETPAARTSAAQTSADPQAAQEQTPQQTPVLPPKRPGQWFVPSKEEMSRSQRRDAEARAKLKPIAPGERPPVIIAATLIAAAIGGVQLIAFLAGAKIHGRTPAPGGTIAFCALMLVCAAGMWRLWYGAVLGFMALLAIVVTLFSLFLIEASNLLGVIVALAIIVGGGYLFFKLVRVLSRIQMPRPPSAPSQR